MYVFCFFFLLIFSACARPYLSLSQEKVDINSLASTYVGSPDPLHDHPPMGQKIIITWSLPDVVFEQKPHIDLHLLFWNNTVEVVKYPLNQPSGTKVYYLLDKEYADKRGILTYKADIVTDDGTVFFEWKHQLWVNLIHIEDELPPVKEPEEQVPALENLEEVDDAEEMSDEFFIPPPPFPDEEPPYLPAPIGANKELNKEPNNEKPKRSKHELLK